MAALRLYAECAPCHARAKRGGPAVLRNPSLWPETEGCVAIIAAGVERLKGEAVIEDIDAEVVARLICGAVDGGAAATAVDCPIPAYRTALATLNLDVGAHWHYVLTSLQTESARCAGSKEIT